MRACALQTRGKPDLYNSPKPPDLEAFLVSLRSQLHAFFGSLQSLIQSASIRELSRCLPRWRIHRQLIPKCHRSGMPRPQGSTTLLADRRREGRQKHVPAAGRGRFDAMWSSMALPAPIAGWTTSNALFKIRNAESTSSIASCTASTYFILVARTISFSANRYVWIELNCASAVTYPSLASEELTRISASFTGSSGTNPTTLRLHHLRKSIPRSEMLPNLSEMTVSDSRPMLISLSAVSLSLNHRCLPHVCRKTLSVIMSSTCLI